MYFFTPFSLVVFIFQKKNYICKKMQNWEKTLFFTRKNGLILTSGAAIFPIHKLNLQNHLSNLHTEFGRNRTFH